MVDLGVVPRALRLPVPTLSQGSASDLIPNHSTHRAPACRSTCNRRLVGLCATGSGDTFGSQRRAISVGEPSALGRQGTGLRWARELGKLAFSQACWRWLCRQACMRQRASSGRTAASSLMRSASPSWPAASTREFAYLSLSAQLDFLLGTTVTYAQDS